MKKFALFVLLAFIATDTGIWAQHYVRYSANTGCTNRIVQSCPVYTNLTEVLYTRDNVSGYLELWVEGVAACRISVPLAYEVKDMKVYGNLLYFCGRSKPYGFIAVANLHDMFQHAMGYGVPPSNAVVAYTLLDNRFVSSLEKLVVYGENGVLPTFPNYNANEHIAAIGRGGSQTTSDRVAVYIKYNNLILNPSIPFLPTVVTVEVLDDLTSPSGDPLQEVLLTDDYVAFVRFRDASSEYVIHRCDKYSLAATYNTIYKYAAPAYEITSSEDAVTLENNNIALATSSSVDANFNSYEIRMRNIDLSSMTMVSSQYIPVGNMKQDLYMTYNSDQHKLVSTMHYELGSGGYEYVLLEIDPWNIFPSLNYYYSQALLDPNYRLFVPMDQTWGAHFVALDNSNWLRKDLPMGSGYNGSCFELRDIQILQLPNLDPVVDVISLTRYEPDESTVLQEPVISKITTNIECIIPE